MFDTVWSDICVWTSSFNISIYLQHDRHWISTRVFSRADQRRLAGDESPISSLKIDNGGGIWMDFNPPIYGEQIRHNRTCQFHGFVTGFQFVAMLMRQRIINQDQIFGGPRLFLAYNQAWAEGEVGPPIHPQQLRFYGASLKGCALDLQFLYVSHQFQSITSRSAHPPWVTELVPDKRCRTQRCSL